MGKPSKQKGGGGGGVKDKALKALGLKPKIKAVSQRSIDRIRMDGLDGLDGARSMQEDGIGRLVGLIS